MSSCVAVPGSSQAVHLPSCSTPGPFAQVTLVPLAPQEEHLGQPDRFLVHGSEYQALRDAVGKAVLEGSHVAIAAVLQVSQHSGRPLCP